MKCIAKKKVYFKFILKNKVMFDDNVMFNDNVMSILNVDKIDLFVICYRGICNISVFFIQIVSHLLSDFVHRHSLELIIKIICYRL